MKKTVLSLTIGFILLGSYSSANAEGELPPGEEPVLASNLPEDDAPLPLGETPVDGDDYVPYPNDGVPPEGDYNPYILNDNEQPSYPGKFEVGSDGLPIHSPTDGMPPEGEFPPLVHLEDFGLSSAQIEFIDADHLRDIDPAAFRAFDPIDFANLPPEALSGFTPEQFNHINRESLEALSETQFHQLPPTVFGELDSERIGGFRPDIVNQFRPEHFDQFTPEQFKQVEPQDVFRMIANSDPEHIKPEHFLDILPAGWEMDENGLMELPEGENFALPPIQRSEVLPPNVFFPEEIPDLSKGLGLGGQGEPLLDGLNQALAGANLEQFDIRQDNKGVIQVTGSDEYQGTNLAFIPDLENMKQGDKGATPGVSQDERGLFVLTTPDGQIIPIRPVPKDLGAIKDLIPEEGGEVKLGKDGDVFLNIPEREGSPARCDVGIFNPIITPAPDGLKPGIHFPDDPAGIEPAIIVYEDGTSQTMSPTVPSPDDFLMKAKEFEGVDDTQFNADGSIGLRYNGQPIELKPTFNVEMKPLPENIKKVEPKIVLKEGGLLEYSYQQGDQIAVFIVNINIL